MRRHHLLVLALLPCVSARLGEPTAAAYSYSFTEPPSAGGAYERAYYADSDPVDDDPSVVTRLLCLTDRLVRPPTYGA